MRFRIRKTSEPLGTTKRYKDIETLEQLIDYVRSVREEVVIVPPDSVEECYTLETYDDWRE